MSSQNPTNQVLPLRFEMLDEIGRGRMGAIYRLRDTAIDREVAGKLPTGNFAAEEGATRRFLREVEITGQLKHPGIPPVYDLGVLPDGRYFMAMELMEGQTLDEFLRGCPDLSAHREWFLDILFRVCWVLAYAHARGVVHRDLEPANIMLGKWGEIRLLDWGLAIVMPERQPHYLSADDRRLGAVYGNPAYMAPEQARGEAADFRTDLFGIGALLCHGLTGAPPFTGGSDTEVAQQAAAGDIDDALARLDRCGADATLVSLAKQCLRPQREERTMMELKQVGSILLAQKSTSAAKAASPWSLGKWLRWS
jgi:serine/threonine protein kinase